MKTPKLRFAGISHAPQAVLPYGWEARSYSMATPVREVDVEVLPKSVPPPPPRPGAPPADPLAALIAKLMDSILQVPGTKVKIGLDPLIGLIPMVGSGASALVSLLLVARAANQGVPIPILIRMIGHIAVNAILDAVPVVGDALSIFYRSNDKNYELLQKHAGTRKKATAADWLLLGALFLGIIGLIVCAFFGAIFIFGQMLRALRGH